MLISPKLFRTAAFLLLVAVCLLPAVFAQGGVKGKVRTASGKGIPDATVTARQDGKDIRSAKADSKGEFTLTGLSKGKYNIVFEADGFSGGLMSNVEVKDGIRNLGDRLILSADQGSLVLIRGSVFFKEGRSVTGAKVDLELVNSDGSTKNVGSTYSNTSGEFAFRRPKGAAKLRVTAKLKGVTGSKEIEVDDAAIYRLAITLPMSAADR